MFRIVPADKLVAAITSATCDIVAAYTLEMRAIVYGLERKKLLSLDDWNEAKNSIPPEMPRLVSDKLNDEMQRRIEKKISELLGSEGPS